MFDDIFKYLSLILFRKMSAEKVMELQQQVRQNSDELQGFLREIGSWTKQMELKDEQLKNKKASREINKQASEPLRSVDELKRKSVGFSEPPSADLEKKSKVEISDKPKLKSYDYDAWAKFDVDRAIEEIDKEDDGKNNGDQSTTTELTPEMKLQKAIVEKEKGNEHFKVKVIFGIFQKLCVFTKF